MDALKDHQLAALVNTLRDIAVEYHGTQQLRERIARAVRAALPSDAAQAPAVPVELMGVADELKNGDGFWRSCSGCHETEDGHPVGNYPFSAVLNCDLGSGCRECGGIGAVWDDTDYGAMADAWDAQEIAREQADEAQAPIYQVRQKGSLKWQDLEPISLSMFADEEKYQIRTVYSAPSLTTDAGAVTVWKTMHPAVCVPLTEDREVADGWRAQGWPVIELVAAHAEQRMSDAARDPESMARRALAATDADRVALIQALQKALAYWMPKVFDDRSAHDAYLLVGYEGDDEIGCWGDQMVAALPRWTPVGESLPTEPGFYLAILKPDNDWGLMSEDALQVEFDVYKAKPKAFTCLYDYRCDEDITEAVTHWMPMPAIDAARKAEIERSEAPDEK